MTLKRTPLKRKTPLRDYTPLKSHKRINKLSLKQKIRNKNLSKIKPPEDGRCEKCHKLPDFRGLQKHHKRFRSQGGNDGRENLIWLCGKCHDKEHGIKDIINGY